jgi:hypothetical protein
VSEICQSPLGGLVDFSFFSLFAILFLWAFSVDTWFCGNCGCSALPGPAAALGWASAFSVGVAPGGRLARTC